VPGGPLAFADVVLAAGWTAAPAVLTARGVRARAVLATAEPAPLAELGWTRDVTVLGPRWLGGDLPGGADQAYVPMPVHRREDLVLVHGEEPFGLLAAAELARRRDDLAFAVSGVRPDLELPFPFLGVEAGAEALTHAFASATVALAPPVRGWRPAALAMLACGQPVVAPDDPAGRAALPPGTAILADGPLAAADAAERLVADLADRAARTRAGLGHVTAGWATTAAALAAALRCIG
jgi:glycosyltransferase involved in cell wall biosynthesis